MKNIFDLRPTLDTAVSTEPSLRDLILQYYKTYFHREYALQLTEEYIEKLEKLIQEK